MFVGLAVLSYGCTNDVPTGDEQDKYVLPTIELTSRAQEVSDYQRAQQFDLFIDALDVEVNGYNHAGNFFISPYGVNMVMGMKANAIGGENGEKLGLYLGTSELNTINELCRAYNDHIPFQGKDSHIDVCNLILHWETLTLNEQYKQDMIKYYDAEISTCPIIASDPMNDYYTKWAEDHGLPHFEDGDRPIYVIYNNPVRFMNFLNFDCKWENPFNKAYTKRGVFYGSEGNTEVEFMWQSETYGYANTTEGEIVEIPFENVKLRMYVILPPKDTDILDYAKSFTYEQYTMLKDRMMSYVVDLTLPKLESSCHISIAPEMLQAHGMVGDYAKLEGAGVDKDCYLGCEQWINFQITEEGAKADIYTGPGKLWAPGFATMKCNRPYMIIVEEKVTGAIILMGFVKCPV